MNWPGMTNAVLAEELSELQDAIINSLKVTDRMLDALDEAYSRISETPDDEDEN